MSKDTAARRVAQAVVRATASAIGSNASRWMVGSANAHLLLLPLLLFLFQPAAYAQTSGQAPLWCISIVGNTFAGGCTVGSYYG